MNSRYNRSDYVWGILATNLIGLKIKILSSTDPTLERVEGTVISETANMLRIETEKKIKSVVKSNQVFLILLPDETKVKVEGKILQGKPEDRIKKRIRRW